MEKDLVNEYCLQTNKETNPPRFLNIYRIASKIFPGGCTVCLLLLSRSQSHTAEWSSLCQQDGCSGAEEEDMHRGGRESLTSSKS